MEIFVYGWCFHPSPEPLGWLLGCALLALDSLDQTTGDLITAGNPHRSEQKQVRAPRRNGAHATATHHPPTAGEAANVHKDRSRAPRPAGQAGLYLAAGTLDRSTRHLATLASGALPLV